MIMVKARVRRAGHQMLMGSEEVVPGDIVLLESGDHVPPDTGLLQVNSPTLDEAFLTGESHGAAKQATLASIVVWVMERHKAGQRHCTVAL
ncbi:MAG: hypothetical protein N3A60_07550 [Thermanaerothrix sp.]|nr:hypothetical protein [Thermanaerothrix sp.]